MSEWISVEDRLPLDADFCMKGVYETMRVLVTDGDHVTMQAFIRGRTDGSKGSEWAEWDDSGYIHADDITHWMPLPEPPTT